MSKTTTSSLYSRLHSIFSTAKTTKPPTTTTTTTKPTSTKATATTATTTIKSITRDLYNERNLERLVEKFKKSSEHKRFRTRYGIYRDVVSRLTAAKRFESIEEILEDQKKYEDISEEGFAARIISLYGKSGMFDHAYKVFDEIPKRTLLSFNALLAACVNAKEFDKINGVFRELPKKLSIEPDLISYNTIIKAFCEMGSFDSAILMLDAMEKNGVAPDLFTFNTILYGFYVNGMFVEGEKIWVRMVEKNMVPDVRSYNAKLLGLAMEKRTKEGVELFEEMRNKGIKPDTFSFNGLIRGFVKEDNLEEAKRWYSEIRKSGCAPDKMTFTTLVPFLCEKGDLGLAFELCENFFKRRYILDETLLQLVVDGLVKKSKIEEANKIVELAKTRYSLTLPSEE